MFFVPSGSEDERPSTRKDGMPGAKLLFDSSFWFDKEWSLRGFGFYGMPHAGMLFVHWGKRLASRWLWKWNVLKIWI